MAKKKIVAKTSGVALAHSSYVTPRVPADPLKPSLALLSKIGSIFVHFEELVSPKGHHVDRIAIDGLLQDPDVQEWIERMGVYLPVKRNIEKKA